VNLLPELRARGVDCHVAVLEAPYDLASELEAAGIQVMRLDLRHRWDVPRALWRLVRLLRTNRYDVVHAHLFFAGVYTALTKPFASRPRRVVTFHNLGYDSYPANTPWRRVRKALDGVLMRHWIDGHVAVSAAVARHYSAQLGLPDITVISNAFPVELLRADGAFDRASTLRRYGIWPDQPLLVVAGRLVHEKGHRFFLDALCILRHAGACPYAVIVGDGPLRPMIANQIVRSGLGSHARIMPTLPHEDLLKILQAADIVVVPSTHEGFPLVPAEAMALGRPVLASAVGGIVELIEQNVSGVLVEPGSSAALANSIAELLADEPHRRIVALEGRHRIERNFSTKSIAAALQDYYARLTARTMPSQSNTAIR
jgi:glycosyltransferase involved in cell wall biosynthesis